MRAFWTIFIAVSAGTIPALVTGIFGLITSRKNASKIEEIHLQMNGELAKRIAMEVNIALRQGRAEGKASEQADQIKRTQDLQIPL